MRMSCLECWKQGKLLRLQPECWERLEARRTPDFDGFGPQTTQSGISNECDQRKVTGVMPHRSLMTLSGMRPVHDGMLQWAALAGPGLRTASSLNTLCLLQQPCDDQVKPVSQKFLWTCTPRNPPHHHHCPLVVSSYPHGRLLPKSGT